MILRKLITLIFSVIFGIGVGSYLITLMGEYLEFPENLTNIIIVFFIFIYMTIAVLMGKNITKEVTQKASVLPSEQRRSPGKTYAWLVPLGLTKSAGFPLIKRVQVVGRDIHSDILINDQSVSKKHAQIMSMSGGFVLKDLDSSNGTFVNNQRVSESYLGDGDMVTFGEVNFIFMCPGSVEQETGIDESLLSTNHDLNVYMDDHLLNLKSGIHTGTRSNARSQESLKQKFKDLKDENSTNTHCSSIESIKISFDDMYEDDNTSIEESPKRTKKNPMDNRNFPGKNKKRR
jgi:pSer/pThr/pTyr-binding forkhead associated (FHA) protein